MSGAKIIAGLNEAVGYADGWNAAIEEAAKVADGHSQSFAQGDGEIYIARAIAKEIRKRSARRPDKQPPPSGVCGSAVGKR